MPLPVGLPCGRRRPGGSSPEYRASSAALPRPTDAARIGLSIISIDSLTKPSSSPPGLPRAVLLRRRPAKYRQPTTAAQSVTRTAATTTGIVALLFPRELVDGAAVVEEVGCGGRGGGGVVAIAVVAMPGAGVEAAELAAGVGAVVAAASVGVALVVEVAVTVVVSEVVVEVAESSIGLQPRRLNICSQVQPCA